MPALNDDNITRMFFVYCVPILALAGASGSTGNANLQIESNAAFEVQKLSFCARSNGADVTASAGLLLQINDSSTNGNLFSQPVPVNAIFGTGQFSFVLPVTRIFAANANLSFTLTSLGNANAVDTYLILTGRKLFGAYLSRNV